MTILALTSFDAAGNLVITLPDGRVATYAPSALSGVQAAPTLIAAETVSLAFSGKQFTGNTGIADLGNVTLKNDWTIGLITRVPTKNSTDYTSGFILSVGEPTASALSDSGTLNMVYSGQYFGAFTNGAFSGSVSLVGVDDAGNSLSSRNTQGASLYGVGISPLVGPYLADGGVHGFVVCCRAGVVEWWHVDPTGTALMMDSSADANPFTGITNKPLRIAGPQLTSIGGNFGGSAFWGQPIQAVFVKHGVAASQLQMAEIMLGADVRNVLALSATAGDSYWPGVTTGATLSELVENNNGTVSGSGTGVGGNLLASTYADFVTITQPQQTSVLRKHFGATASDIRLYGTRNGPATTIQLQLVKYGSPFPATGTDVVDAWQTVATGATGNWSGTFTATVAHNNPLGPYDWEERHTTAGVTSAVTRQNKQFILGMTIVTSGQSIVQKFYDDQGPQVAIPGNEASAVHFYDNPSTSAYFSNVVIQNRLNGWSQVYGYDRFGASTMVVKLASLISAGVGYANQAIGGQGINSYIPSTTSPFARMAKSIVALRPHLIVWGNGQADATMSQATRWAALDTFLQQVDAVVATAPGGPFPYTFAIYPINNDFGPAAADPGPIRAIDMAWVTSRAANMPTGVVNCAAITTLAYTLDQQNVDGTHPTDNNNGFGILAERFAQTAAYLCGAVTGPGYAPPFTSVGSTFTTSGGNTVVTMKVASRIDVTGLATAEGGPVTGAELSLDGNTWISATGAIVNATTVTFTATSVPASGVTSIGFRYQYGRPTTYTGSSPGTPTATQAGTVNALYDTRGCTISLNEAGNLLPGFPVPPVQVPLAITGSGATGGGTTTPPVTQPTTPTGTTPTIVQMAVLGGNSPTARTITLPNAATVGNHVLLLVNGYNDPAPTFVYTPPTGFTLAGRVHVASTNLDFSVFFGPVSALVANGVTFAEEFTGNNAFDVLLLETTGTSVASGALVTTNNNTPNVIAQVPALGGTNPLRLGFMTVYCNAINSGGFTATGGAVLFCDIGQPTPGNFSNYYTTLFSQTGTAAVTLTQVSSINCNIQDNVGLGLEITQ